MDGTEGKHNHVLIKVLNSKQNWDKELETGLTLIPVIAVLVCSDPTEAEVQLSIVWDTSNCHQV